MTVVTMLPGAGDTSSNFATKQCRHLRGAGYLNRGRDSGENNPYSITHVHLKDKIIIENILHNQANLTGLR